MKFLFYTRRLHFIARDSISLSAARQMYLAH